MPKNHQIIKIENPHEQNTSSRSQSVTPLHPFRHREKLIEAGSTRLLDRYKTSSSKFTLSTQNHFVISKNHFWKKGLKRKLFLMTKDSIFQARAKFKSFTSRKISIENQHGLICKLQVGDTYHLFFATELVMTICRNEEGGVSVHFIETEDWKFPYTELVSPAVITSNTREAFGERVAIPSVKNCRLCCEEKEVVAVRKISKTELAIDSLIDVSFLYCFAIGIFMFCTT